MFNVHRKEINWGGRKLVLETGRIARQADGAVLATYGETVVLCTAVGAKAAEAGDRFLPADRQLPGKDLRRRQDPRRLLQARRPADGEGGADLAPHRPSDPPAVRSRLPQRDPGRLHGPEPRPGERSRCRRADRRLGGADHLRHSLHGPDRRRARRLCRRPVRPEPAAGKAA